MSQQSLGFMQVDLNFIQVDLNVLHLLIAEMRPTACCDGVLIHAAGMTTLVCAEDCKWQQINLLLTQVMVGVETHKRMLAKEDAEPACTGGLVHDEYTFCPRHDHRHVETPK